MINNNININTNNIKDDDDIDIDIDIVDVFERALKYSTTPDLQLILLKELLLKHDEDEEDNKEDYDDEQALFLDLRSAEAYAKHSLEKSVNIPFEDIQGSFHLLPPRDTGFVILLREDYEFEKQRETFTKGDFKGIKWNITHCFVYNEHFVNAVEQILLLQSQRRTKTILELHQNNHNNNQQQRKKLHRLWRPSPSVVELYKTFLAASEKEGSEKWSVSGAVLDLGAGCGRDSIYLAMKGFNVFAFDSDDSALTRIKKLSKMYGVSDRVQPVKWNAATKDKDAAFEKALEKSVGSFPLKLVLGVRFCYKPLFEQMVSKLPCGCYLAWFHFAVGCKLSKVGRPNKEKDLILPCKELRSIFSEERGYEVLRDDVTYLSDSRPIANFVAKKL